MLEARRGLLRAVARLAATLDRRPRSCEGARRLLVCATGGLGNTLLLLPLLRTLRLRLPGARIDLLLTSSAAADLARELRFADDVLHVREMDWYEGLKPLRLFGSRLRPRQYDVVLRTFVTAPSMARASLAVYLCGARVRAAYGDERANPFETHVLRLDSSEPEIARHLALARSIGLEPVPGTNGVVLPERGGEFARNFLARSGWDGRPLLGIHPGSDAYYLAKRWPAERFGALAAEARRRFGVQPMVLGGPDDAQAVSRVVEAAGPGVPGAVGQDIIETGGLLRSCAAFVSNDSGLMHLASALGVPTLAIFGPTDPVKNTPLGGRTEILRLGLPCSPCDHEMATRLCAHRDCLNTIGVDRVLRSLEPLLQDAGGARAGGRADRT